MQEEMNNVDGGQDQELAGLPVVGGQAQAAEQGFVTYALERVRQVLWVLSLSTPHPSPLLRTFTSVQALITRTLWNDAMEVERMLEDHEEEENEEVEMMMVVEDEDDEDVIQAEFNAEVVPLPADIPGPPPQVFTAEEMVVEEAEGEGDDAVVGAHGEDDALQVAPPQPQEPALQVAPIQEEDVMIAEDVAQTGVVPEVLVPPPTLPIVEGPVPLTTAVIPVVPGGMGTAAPEWMTLATTTMSIADVPPVPFGPPQVLLDWAERREAGLTGADLGVTLINGNPGNRRVHITASDMLNVGVGGGYLVDLRLTGSGVMNAGLEAQITLVVRELPPRWLWTWFMPLFRRGAPDLEMLLAAGLQAGDLPHGTFAWYWEVRVVGVRRATLSQADVDSLVATTNHIFTSLNRDPYIDHAILFAGCTVGGDSLGHSLFDLVESGMGIPLAVQHLPLLTRFLSRMWAAAKLGEGYLCPRAGGMGPIYRMLFCGTAPAVQVEEGMEEHAGDAIARNIIKDEMLKNGLHRLASSPPDVPLQATLKTLATDVNATEVVMTNQHFAHLASETGLISYYVDEDLSPAGTSYRLTLDDAADAIEQAFYITYIYGSTDGPHYDPHNPLQLNPSGVYRFANLLGLTPTQPLPVYLGFFTNTLMHIAPPDSHLLLVQVTGIFDINLHNNPGVDTLIRIVCGSGLSTGPGPSAKRAALVRILHNRGREIFEGLVLDACAMGENRDDWPNKQALTQAKRKVLALLEEVAIDLGWRQTRAYSAFVLPAVKLSLEPTLLDLVFPLTAAIHLTCGGQWERGSLRYARIMLRRAADKLHGRQEGWDDENMKATVVAQRAGAQALSNRRQAATLRLRLSKV